MKRHRMRKVLQALVVTLVLPWYAAEVAADTGKMAERISMLTRGSNYRLVKSTPLSFDTHHTQGMTIVGDKIYLTAVHAINKAQGEEIGYLYEIDMDGNRLRSIKLGEGAIYHPGGIDFDGKYIWVSVAEYRPNSSSIVYRVNPKKMKAEEMFRFDDHLGGIVSLPDSHQLVGVSWGSRTFYRWDLDKSGNPDDAGNPHRQKNGSHFVDYQDGQWVKGTALVLFGGLAGYRSGGEGERSMPLGGIALVNANTLQAEFEVPVSLYTDGGGVMNQNPFYVQSTEKGLTLYFIPEDTRSTLYTYTVRMK